MANDQQKVPFNWPTGSDDRPQALITTTVRELIPTAKFANVEISNTVTRFVDDTQVEEGLSESYSEADKVLQVERDKILDDIESGNS